MNISKIEIKNFKSFKDVSVNLNDFNVVIGACAAGKSNFIDAFNFLKDLSEDLMNALGRHGLYFIQNLANDPNQPTCIKVTFGDGKPFLNRLNEKHNRIQYKSLEYEVCINFNNNAPIINETVKFDFNLDNGEFYENSLLLKNQNFKITAEFENDNDNIELEDFVPGSLLNIVNENFKDEHGLIINSALATIPFNWSNYFKNITYYNLDPKFCRLDDDTGKAVLKEYGENLNLVLEEILDDDENNRKFLNLLSSLLPYVEGIEMLKLDDDRRMFRLDDKYIKSKISSLFISDGTMDIIALICALYFESGDIILIEEPERNIHPGLFIQLVSMIKEVSQRKQVIMTTHSPELLNSCDLDDIYFVSRDEKGSVISKPIDNKQIKDFIDELGIGQVFVDNYLDFGIE